LTGATYDEQFTAKTSVIICNPPAVNAAKLKFATGKRIPAVTPTWLWECLRSGRLQPYGEYQLNKPATPPPQKTKEKLERQDNALVVPLSEAESDKTQQKKPQAAKMVTKPQAKQRPQKPGTLNLAPSAHVAPVSTTDSANNDTNNQTYDDDEPAIGNLDGAASYPLQETTGNSPRRPSTSLNTFSRTRSSSAESLIVPRSAEHRLQIR
jgi:DNA replication regulator DPB11